MPSKIKRVVAYALVFLCMLLVADLLLKVTLLRNINHATSDAEHAMMQRWTSFYLSTFIVVMISFVPLHAAHTWLSWVVDKSISRPFNLLLIVPSLFVLFIWTNAFGVKVWLFG